MESYKHSVQFRNAKSEGQMEHSAHYVNTSRYELSEIRVFQVMIKQLLQGFSRDTRKIAISSYKCSTDQIQSIYFFISMFLMFKWGVGFYLMK